MIQLHSNKMTVDAGLAIPLKHIDVQTDNVITPSGTRIIQFERKGFYIVFVNAEVKRGTASIQLMQDSDYLESTLRTSGGAIDIVCLIECKYDHSLLSLMNVGDSSFCGSVNVVVGKL